MISIASLMLVFLSGRMGILIPGLYKIQNRSSTR